MSGTAGEIVPAETLSRVVAAIFVKCGLGASPAAAAAEDIVAADLEGVASHGIMLVPMYVRRLKAGSVTPAAAGRIVSDRGSAIVIDAENILGQLSARQAVDLAALRAVELGSAVVAVRNAFHFGTAGRYARMLGERDCIGMVLSNTRPLMPAPGGAEPLIGNNPLAVAAPSAGDFLPEVDMALSAVAMGKIRNAAAAGNAIPEGWAVDKDGLPTNDPNAAIAGMLLPAAGPKGFGLAFMNDLLAGGLSDGAIGAEVRPLYGDASAPYRCSNLFIAIHVGHFLPADRFKDRAKAEAERVSQSKRAAGTERIYAPGELAFASRSAAAGNVKVSAAAWKELLEVGVGLGVDIEAMVQ